MPRFMANGTTTLLNDGSVLVAGGSSSHVTRNIALRYFPATNRWEDAGSFNGARHYQVAALLPDGKVLIAGGSLDDRTTLSSAALYDPATNDWTDVAPMASPRSNATATLMPNGKVLVAGGEAASGGIYPTYLRTAELFDPASNTWSPAPSMAEERANASATLLSDGRVLVAGGTVDAFDSTASAEIYTPDGWPFPRGGGSGGGGGGGTGGGGGSGAGGTPSISRLALSATRFRAAGSGPSVTAARQRRAPVGTTITYGDGAAATATFAVQRPTAGRRSNGRCAKPTHANRRKAHCTRWVTVGRFRHADAAGTNTLRFSGRVNGHKLSPGRYRLSITARIGRGRASSPTLVGFRIVR